MTPNKVTYETGATSHAVNDLILFTDNTRELAELRDTIYSDGVACGNNMGHLSWFQSLLNKSRAAYCNQFGGDNSIHIIDMKDEEKEEYKRIYANDFENWKSEHGYK